MEDRSRRRARLILIVGVLLALLAGLGTFFLASSSKTEVAPVIPTADVLVAAREIAPRTVVSAADLKVAKVNTDVVPPTALKDPKDVVGKIATLPISTGEFILPTKFAATAAAAFTVFPPNEQPQAGQPIPPGSPNYRAMSITVPDNNAVGGAVQVGDLVDAMYTLALDAAKFSGPVNPNRIADQSVKIALERLPIIAKAGNVYTIRVDAETAERIQYLQASGAQLSFLLRAAQDDRAAKTQGATFAPVYELYQFRIPVKVAPAP